MIYRLTADLLVLIHLGFILFAVLGGLLVLKYRPCFFFHLPALVWAILIALFGWVCPLTPLENRLRELGGVLGYETSFIEQYLLPIIYPGALTRRKQVFLGLLVLIINLVIYRWIVCRTWKTRT